MAVTLISFSLFAQPQNGQGKNSQGPGQGRGRMNKESPEGRRGPPKEAFDACSGKQQDDSCSFTTPRGEMTGTCFQPPHKEGAKLACRPAKRPQ